MPNSATTWRVMPGGSHAGHQRRRGVRLVGLLIAVGWSLVAGPGCLADKPPARSGVVTVSHQQSATWVRNFNPLMPNSRWPAAAGVYEPMMVFNTAKDSWTPWLATAARWVDDLTLEVDIRDGVLFSDGTPFTAADVAFTFGLVKQHKALDQRAVWSFLASVEATSPTGVRFVFSKRYAPGFGDLMEQPIVAKHIYAKVKDPVSFADATPVGTGPFTEINAFRPQVYELGKNPHYWQPGKPMVDALRLPAFVSNDAANLALVMGEVDWSGNFIPAVDRVFVNRDPEHHGYWFAEGGGMVFLYANTARGPTQKASVRKALSHAVNRELLVEVAMYNYTSPARAHGLSETYAAWRDPSAIAGDADNWTRFDPDAAKRLLAGAAVPADWSPSIIVVSGWSDWVRAAQVVARSLQGVGVNARVETYEFGAWFERVQKGDFDLAIGWSVEGPTPYSFYKWLMSAETRKPLGETSSGNWHRFADPAASKLLEQFQVTTERAAQGELSNALQRRFVATAPAIPLFANPLWGAYNTSRIEGFPTAADPYAPLAPHKMPACLLTMTSLKPVTK